MRRLVCGLAVIWICAGCSSDWNFKNPVRIDETEKKIVIESKPPVEIAVKTDWRTAIIAAKTVEDNIMLFQTWDVSKANKIELTLDAASDDYLLMAEVAEQYFAHWKNKSMLFGLIEWIRRNRIAESETKTDFVSMILRGERYRFIRIADFENLFAASKLTPQDMLAVNIYINRFLLKQDNLLFISVQELAERNSVYFSSKNIQDVFFQIVVVPETELFVRFLIAKFGFQPVLDFSKREYSKDAWTMGFKEEVFETEKAYAEWIEKSEMTPNLRKAEFTNEMNRLLNLYNCTTKQTMFQKAD